ncbi:GDSL-type esterase/lipase family protein [Actinoplanes utahensis]|uniref:SGNH hydrolase-type esterase domain-containing protein n=1 Tax=Actinoplanes utahensis TaxID=1869 RepID=A0A0A6UKJ3_ACTUT|nr:GDSL-type esterase/lipase family protein [Actinoplanes utahensis]KHD75603.1 hypothetical protein MB27_21500 [Actinoplanes utahensis]GIF27120.1 hypothetical protein Aut01nite_01060 [Actinoplanes utahensis]
MTDRRTFIRAGGLLAGGVAVAAVAAESARAAGPSAVVPLLTWHAALANRRYAPAVVAVLGSSTSEGVGVTRHGRGYPEVLADNLRAAFPVAGAPGGGNYVAAWGVPRDWPVTLTGGGTRVKTAGWGLKTWAMDRAGQSAAHTFTGTSVQVWFSAVPGGGSFAVEIDGTTVAPVVATAAGKVDRDARWTSGTLARGEHRIVVTNVTGTSAVHGFATFDGDEDRGIQVFNGGQGGRTSGDFARHVPGWAPRLASIRPHLVILQLGVNDWRIDVPAAEMKDNLKKIIDAVRSSAGTDPSFVVYGSPRVVAGQPEQDFAVFTRAWQEIAAQDTGGPGGGSGVAYFDLAACQLPPSIDNAHGLYCDDLLHTTDKGAAFTADALAGFIAP